MMYLIHQENKVLRILDSSFKVIDFETKPTITDALFELAKSFPQELLIWCHESYVDKINISQIANIFHHKGIMASYSVSGKNYIPKAIGYVDQSIYLKVNREVCYPTWLMSSDIGGMHAELLNVVFNNFKRHSNFNFFINALAKKAMPQGLFCYSEPSLLLNKTESVSHSQASTHELFLFVKNHYKWVWVYILFWSFVIYLKQAPLISLLKTIFSKQEDLILDFKKVVFRSNKKVIHQKTIDVVIPTMGRKKYLYDVLKDLSNQSILPKHVIIVEQNPDENSVSELDYLTQEPWPFNIKHKFIHQSGVCNARNIAMSLVESEWVFFGDDDIRFDSGLIEKSFVKIEQLAVKSINATCLQINENQQYFKTTQTPIFGSGTSIVRSELFKSIKFDLSFEHGYGEDSDFGMQIRNQGEDVVFAPEIIITHLKAPFGGYRFKHIKPWEIENTMPKPSPTVLLFNLRHLTKEQNQGYKLLLFIKFYKSQPIKNPFSYLANMKKRWKMSLVWAEKLKTKTSR